MRRFLPLVVTLAACSSSANDPPPAPPFVAHFDLADPSFLSVPFPSDRYRQADGTILLDVNGLDRIVPSQKGAQYVVDAFAGSRGYGVSAGVLFRLDDGEPDASTLPNGEPGSCGGKDSTVIFFDVDAGKAVDCQAHWSSDAAFGLDTKPVLTVRPARGIVLGEQHRIAVLLTDGVKDQHGNALQIAPDFLRLRDGQRDDDLRKRYGDAIDAAVAKTGVDRARVVSAAMYTTGDQTGAVRAARELVRKMPAPTLKWGAADVAPVAAARFTDASPLPDGWTASLDALFGTPNKLPSGEDDPDFGADTNPGVAHDAIGAIGVAAFDAPNFLVEKSGFDDVHHHLLYRDATGAVAPFPDKPTSKIWVTFVVPKGDMPAAGWPVVVYQHGLGGQRGDSLALANSFARRGWATAAIEPVMLATRGLDANARGDKKSDYARKTSTYHGPDGFIDTAADGTNGGTTDLFGGLYRIAAMRDHFRQSVIDHATLVHLLGASPTLDGLSVGAVTPKIDGSKIAYTGSSLGGILGGMLSGVETDDRAFVLNVPGAGVFTELAPNSPQISSLLNGAAALFFGLGRAQVPPWHPLPNMLQHVVDGGDPISYVPTSIGHGGHGNVVMIEVMRDEIVSNASTEAMARAMGIPVIAPHASISVPLAEISGMGAHDVPAMGGTAALIQVSPGEHGFDLFHKSGRQEYAVEGPTFGDPSADVFTKLPKAKTFTNPYLELQAAVLPFIEQAFAGKVPTLSWALAPAPVSD